MSNYFHMLLSSLTPEAIRRQKELWVIGMTKEEKDQFDAEEEDLAKVDEELTEEQKEKETIIGVDVGNGKDRGAERSRRDEEYQVTLPEGKGEEKKEEKTDKGEEGKEPDKEEKKDDKGEGKGEGEKEEKGEEKKE